MIQNNIKSPCEVSFRDAAPGSADILLKSQHAVCIPVAKEGPDFHLPLYEDALRSSCWSRLGCGRAGGVCVLLPRCRGRHRTYLKTGWFPNVSKLYVSDLFPFSTQLCFFSIPLLTPKIMLADELSKGVRIASTSKPDSPVNNYSWIKQKGRQETRLYFLDIKTHVYCHNSKQ